MQLYNIFSSSNTALAAKFVVYSIQLQHEFLLYSETQIYLIILWWYVISGNGHSSSLYTVDFILTAKGSANTSSKMVGLVSSYLSLGQ